MKHFLLSCVLLLGLAACGDEQGGQEAGIAWQHCRVEGLNGAGGLAFFEDSLIAVAGGGDRSVYVFERSALKAGGQAHARVLDVDVVEDAFLMGSEKFALQGYQLKHLWDLSLDFQGVAVQAPHFLYLGDRIRRVIYWGRLFRDASGHLARARLRSLCIAPGARRTAVDEGDWRDKGPGLSGLVAVDGRRRTEDIYVADRGSPDETVLRVRKMDRYGSNLGGLSVLHGLDGQPDVNAISWSKKRFHLTRGAGAGELLEVDEPKSGLGAKVDQRDQGPQVEGVEIWSGMCHAPDGTLFLVSNGTPAVVAWRAPAK